MRQDRPTTRNWRREPIYIRAHRPPVDTVQCTYVGDYSRTQCMQQAPKDTGRCALPGHGGTTA